MEFVWFLKNNYFKTLKSDSPSTSKQSTENIPPLSDGRKKRNIQRCSVLPRSPSIIIIINDHKLLKFLFSSSISTALVPSLNDCSGH